MNIFVTGATGLVGGAIVEELFLNKPKNWEIYPLGNRQAVNDSKAANFLPVDVTDLRSFAALENLGSLDIVVHAAGLAHQFRNADKKRFLEVNVEGTKNILKFAAEKSIRHFILISSVSVYGLEKGNEALEKIKKTDEKKPCFPKGEYAVSKLMSEKEAIKICREKNIALTILRLATVVGEGDRGNVWRLIKAIDQKRFLMIGKGENYKTLIYKKDVARACRSILEKKDLTEREIEIFNLAAEPVRMRDIVDMIAACLGKKQPVFFVPVGLINQPLNIISKLIRGKKIKSFSETLNKWTSNEMFANEKIRQKYSFETKTAVSEALRREVDFYIKKQKCNKLS